ELEQLLLVRPQTILELAQRLILRPLEAPRNGAAQAEERKLIVRKVLKCDPCEVDRGASSVRAAQRDEQFGGLFFRPFERLLTRLLLTEERRENLLEVLTEFRRVRQRHRPEQNLSLPESWFLTVCAERVAPPLQALSGARISHAAERSIDH